MSGELSKQQCEACQVDAPKVSDDELASLLAQIPDWVPEVNNGVMMLERVYKCYFIRVGQSESYLVDPCY